MNDLVKEYRPTMDKDVLHSWAKDVVSELGKLQQIKQERDGEIELLRDSLKQILGWRELRDTNDIPIERIEDVAREALTQPKEQDDE